MQATVISMNLTGFRVMQAYIEAIESPTLNEIEPVVHLVERYLVKMEELFDNPDPAKLRRQRLEALSWTRYAGMQTSKLLNAGVSPDTLRRAIITPKGITLPAQDPA